MIIDNPAITGVCVITAGRMQIEPFYKNIVWLANLAMDAALFEVTAVADYIALPAWLPAFCTPSNTQRAAVNAVVNGEASVMLFEFRNSGDVFIYKNLSEASFIAGDSFRFVSQSLLCIKC